MTALHEPLTTHIPELVHLTCPSIISLLPSLTLIAAVPQEESSAYRVFDRSEVSLYSKLKPFCSFTSQVYGGEPLRTLMVTEVDAAISSGLFGSH
jgi:hypothetical protein